MKKKILILILLLLLVTGCNKANKEETKEVTEEPTVTETKPNWYNIFLEKITNADDKIVGYYIVDIDNDKTPELILVSGENEAEKTGEIFKLDNNELKSHNQFSLSHSILYSTTNGYIIRQMAHMSNEIIYNLSLTDEMFEEIKISNKEYEEDEEYQKFDNQLTEHNILDVTPLETYEEA